LHFLTRNFGFFNTQFSLKKFSLKKKNMLKKYVNKRLVLKQFSVKKSCEHIWSPKWTQVLHVLFKLYNKLDNFYNFFFQNLYHHKRFRYLTVATVVVQRFTSSCMLSGSITNKIDPIATFISISIGRIFRRIKFIISMFYPQRNGWIRATHMSTAPWCTTMDSIFQTRKVVRSWQSEKMEKIRVLYIKSYNLILKK